MMLASKDYDLACKGCQLFLAGRFGQHFDVEMAKDHQMFQTILRIAVVTSQGKQYVLERWDDLEMVERKWYEYQPRDETVTTIMLLLGT